MRYFYILAALFITIAGGIIVNSWWQPHLPSSAKDAVLNVVSEVSDSTSEVVDTISGSLVPTDDRVNPYNNSINSGTVTTLPALPASADWLTPSQRDMLSTLGIDESELPATLTPDLEACFIESMGQDRVDAIKAGETPSLFEGMKAMSCL